MNAGKGQIENNLALWLSVEKTDKKFIKPVNFGKRKYTAIAAQYQLKLATKTWGPYGKEWGVKECKYTYLKGQFVENSMVIEKIVELTLDAIFYYPDGEFEISTDIKYAPGADCKKKILTDLTTKALSKLGFNADIFMDGKTDLAFTDNKYQNPVKGESGRNKRAKAKLTNAKFQGFLNRFTDAKSAKDKMKLLESLEDFFILSPEQKYEVANLEQSLISE